MTDARAEIDESLRRMGQDADYQREAAEIGREFGERSGHEPHHCWLPDPPDPVGGILKRLGVVGEYEPPPQPMTDSDRLRHLVPYIRLVVCPEYRELGCSLEQALADLALALRAYGPEGD